MQKPKTSTSSYPILRYREACVIYVNSGVVAPRNRAVSRVSYGLVGVCAFPAPASCLPISVTRSKNLIDAGRYESPSWPIVCQFYCGVVEQTINALILCHKVVGACRVFLENINTHPFMFHTYCLLTDLFLGSSPGTWLYRQIPLYSSEAHFYYYYVRFLSSTNNGSPLSEELTRSLTRGKRDFSSSSCCLAFPIYIHSIRRTGSSTHVLGNRNHSTPLCRHEVPP